MNIGICEKKNVVFIHIFKLIIDSLTFMQPGLFQLACAVQLRVPRGR